MMPASSSEPPSITCPRCGMTSYNPNDVREGYCGNCHEFTRQQVTLKDPGRKSWGPEHGVTIGVGADGPHEHDWVYKDDEYDSLANGGSYEIYECSTCAKTKYVQLPD